MKFFDKQPLVSIIITSYNRAAWLEDAIRSALAQDYKNLEIIISDNHSEDNSDTVIKKYVGDSRIKYNRNDVNIGMIANGRKATEQLAGGMLVSYISSDDYLVRNTFISEAVAAFTQFDHLVAYSAINKTLIVISGEEKHNPAFAYKKEHGFFNCVSEGKKIFNTFRYCHLLNFGGAVFVRKDLIDNDIFREPNTTYVDLQALLLLALRGDFYFADHVSYVQRFHSQNASMGFADAKKCLLNLSFAEVPYEEAKKKQIFTEEELLSWRRDILRPFIINPMISFYKKGGTEYGEFTAGIQDRYPEILADIESNIKFRMFKMVYGNKLLRRIYEKLKPVINGKK